MMAEDDTVNKILKDDIDTVSGSRTDTQDSSQNVDFVELVSRNCS